MGAKWKISGVGFNNMEVSGTTWGMMERMNIAIPRDPGSCKEPK
jgi:hypothetical protein